MSFLPAFNIATRTALGEIVPLKTTTVQLKDGATVLTTVDSDEEGFVDYTELGATSVGTLIDIVIVAYPGVSYDEITYDTAENAIGRRTTLLFEDLLVGGTDSIEYDVFMVDVDDDTILPEKLASNLSPNVTYKFERENIAAQKYKQLVFQCRDADGQEAEGVIIGDYLASPTLSLPPATLGVSIGDAIGNSPVADGILYANSAGNFQNNNYLKYDSINNGLIVDYAKIYTPTVNSVVIGNIGTSLLGADCTVIGYQALENQTGTGGNNSVFGAKALYTATNTANSTAFGSEAGYSFTGGSGLFFGQGAARNLTSGSQGTFVGLFTGYNSTTAIGQTYVGHKAGYYATGSQNVAIGNYAVQGQAKGATGYYSVGIGGYALYNLTSGIGNVGIGYQAGYNVANHSYNILFGYQAGYNVAGKHNIFSGYQAGYSVAGKHNIFSGYQAGYYATGDYNIFSGYQAGFNVTGYYNILFGYQAGYNAVIGSVAIGYSALKNNAATHSIGIGYTAGFNATGNYSVLLGYQAGYVAGGGNVAIGYSSLRYVTGAYNCAMGFQALRGDSAGGAGAYNVSFGFRSGYLLTSGNYNVYLGQNTGYSNKTGSNNVFIGCNAGYNETGSNKLYIDSTNTSTPLIYGEFDNDLLQFNANVEFADDAEFLDSDFGIILLDRDDDSPWRLYIDSGVLNIEAV